MYALHFSNSNHAHSPNQQGRSCITGSLILGIYEEAFADPQKQFNWLTASKELVLIQPNKKDITTMKQPHDESFISKKTKL